ncbi:MAG: dipeptide ABC transporter ATP-binding protein [Phenylobacterium sp.]|uniref:ABC transporter ATP-binding protein n=1 Tax=Phenylobacterium sp. TaxID=1871053 RepID=UPI0025F4C18C|nr:dipeptide ABC transporter ATP-binding protein [Phenylobacterium sp.]MBI1200445.1 dipeptide ABC transporter ATP-binding protein [Phenylobacterium sp.]
MSLLSIRDLTLGIGGAEVLKGVSLDLAAGEIVGLVGESGSGKSMTGLSVLCLLPPGAVVSGRIELDGQDLTSLSEPQMRAVRGAQVGMVFQEPMTALDPLMTIGDQVAETLRIHRGLGRAAAREAAAAALARAGLPPDRFPLSRYPHELSGGQRQRVAIAIATALKPKVLIADEPTTALDVTTQAQILELLKGLAREDGCGLILITHDLAVVAETVDRVAIMRAGEIVEQGPVAALGALTHPYAQRLAKDAVLAETAPAPAPADGAPVVEATDVLRTYAPRRSAPWRRAEPFRAVDGVSLAVRPGETVGLVGESGSGKSTLLRAVLGLEALQGGAVSLDGRPFSPPSRGDARRLRRQVQAVFQDPYGSFDPRWRVADLVAEPLHLLDDPPTGAARRGRVAAVLEKVGLPADAIDRYPHQFSGGQRQRIAIARALITEPRLVVLDEAVSALDVTVRAQILALLADLSRELGVAYLFVTHDLGVVRAVCHRVLVMQAGRIVEEGETAQVFASPRHPYTQTLLAATPDLRRALAARGA